MTLEEYKKKIGQSTNKKNYFKNLIVRVFLSIILMLSILIICNISDVSKNFIMKNLFETNFKFSSITKIFNKYFINNESTSEGDVPVNKNVEYSSIEAFESGVSLGVIENYPVKILGSGIVVFIGQKDNFGNTVIIQQSNGVDVWYGNVSNVSVKLYDYVEVDTIIASATNKLYMAFQKDGVFLDYNEFIK